MQRVGGGRGEITGAAGSAGGLAGERTSRERGGPTLRFLVGVSAGITVALGAFAAFVAGSAAQAAQLVALVVVAWVPVAIRVLGRSGAI